MPLYSPAVQFQNSDQKGNDPDTGNFGSGYDLAGYYLNPEDEKNKFMFSAMQLKIFERTLKTNPVFRNMMLNHAKKLIKENPELTKEGLVNKFKSLMAAGVIALSAIASPAWMNAFAATGGDTNNIPSEKEIKTALNQYKYYGEHISSNDLKTIKWLQQNKPELLKAKKVVDTKKQQNNTKIKDTTISYSSDNQNNKTNIQTTPINNSQDYSPEFINYIKTVENAGKEGFKNGRWFPHESPEGGLMTIGYGHKLKSIEDQNKVLKSGLSQEQVEKLLIKDLNRSKIKLYSDLKEMGYGNKKLNKKQEEMLLDYVFNLGTIHKFPKFTKAVVNGDLDTMRKEYKRTYKDSNGIRVDLSGRNTAFYNTFLK